MIRPEDLEHLRCPMDPARQARLVDAEDHLRCERCALRFHVRDGFPSLVVQDAELPPGCPDLSRLPCQTDARSSS
jgi:uncharacterized protein YbaR (Trm112 family)